MFIDNYIRRFFADAEAPKETPESFVDHATSDLLAYRSFDPKTGLFFNEHNFGFMLEVAAQQFTDERAKSIISVLETSLDDGMSIQFINWCGPEIGGKLGRWSAGRKGRGALVDRVTEQRREHLMAMRYGSDGSIPVVPHNRRAFICVWQSGAENQETHSKLAKIRKDIVNAFGGKRSALECSPQDLLDLLGQLLHCAAPGGEFTADYSENDFLNYQLPGSRIRVAADHIELAGNPSLKVASSVVARYPADWATHINEMLNGDPSTPTARPIGPVLTSFTARAMNSAQAKAKIGRKLTGVMSNAGTSMEKWMPDLGEKKKEFHDLNILLDSGGRLFETVYSVSSYAKADIFESDPIGRMAGIYRSVGLHFSDDRHLQLPILLGSLPFGMHDKFLEDFKRSMRMRIMPADAVGVLAPLSGEYAGTYKFSGIPLIGRQNALSNWSNFDSSANYNVTVVGKSGAGKSVLMQDLSMAHYAEGGRIIVVDDGRSFEGLCNILGGDFIAFGDGEIAELNPFALVDAERMLEEASSQGLFAE